MYTIQIQYRPEQLLSPAEEFRLQQATFINIADGFYCCLFFYQITNFNLFFTFQLIFFSFFRECTGNSGTFFGFKYFRNLMCSQLGRFQCTYTIVPSSLQVSPTMEKKEKEKKKEEKKKKKRISAAIKCIVTWASRTSKLVVKLATENRKKAKSKKINGKSLSLQVRATPFYLGSGL